MTKLELYYRKQIMDKARTAKVRYILRVIISRLRAKRLYQSGGVCSTSEMRKVYCQLWKDFASEKEQERFRAYPLIKLCEIQECNVTKLAHGLVGYV